jgi:hypothetical protein
MRRSFKLIRQIYPEERPSLQRGIETCGPTFGISWPASDCVVVELAERAHVQTLTIAAWLKLAGIY